ncbi:MAG: hypothetical protein LH616_01530 [Ilumatobacteraceae bacterium]|nr:hypothetical protein [Ilumatobacteraceae bacterium]
MTDSVPPPPASETSGGDASRTRRVVRTEHKQPLLRNGIICAAVGLGAVIGGAVMFSALQAAQVLSPIADADMGDTLTFDGEDGSYAIVLKRGEISDENVVDRLVRDTTCIVVASDGTTRTIEGSRQASSSQTDFGASIGTFTAPDGPTQVTCVGTGSRLLLDRYAVAPERKAALYVSYGILAFGVIVGLVGISLIKRAWNSTSVVERVPA